MLPPEENQMDPGNDSELLQTHPSIRQVAAFVLDITVCLLQTCGDLASTLSPMRLKEEDQKQFVFMGDGQE